MTYRDMTFCSGDGCAKFEGCPRALTEEVKAAADRWWKRPEIMAQFSVPISQFTDPRELDCWEGGEK